jgi:apolipoprotein N-acyltransferase
MYIQNSRVAVRNIKKIFNVVFLIGFFVITLFINFLHTEKTVKDDVFCPACHFLASALTTGQIHFFSLPPLIFLATFFSSDLPSVKGTFILSSFSRSPPQA